MGVVEGVVSWVVMIVVGTVVARVAVSWWMDVMVVGWVVATVARSCWMIVTVTAALVTVLVSVTDTLMVVVTVDGFAFPEFAPAPAGLGDGRSLAMSVALGMGRSLAIPETLGVGMSFPILGALGVGASFPLPGTLGAAASFPTSLSFSFRGDRTEFKDPRTDRGKNFMFEMAEMKMWWPWLCQGER